jgi:hypothetical protein
MRPELQRKQTGQCNGSLIKLNSVSFDAQDWISEPEFFSENKRKLRFWNNDYAWYGDEYDEYTMDSMLYGVDYIAPVPSTLPPLKKKDSFNGDKKIKAEVERFNTDENGIQSNNVPKLFPQGSTRVSTKYLPERPSPE